MNDLTKLKTLLLQDEIDKIDQITANISALQNQQDRDILVDRLSTIITDILSKSLKDNQTKLYHTLYPIISKGVMDELNDSNKNLKEILFPIISSSIQEQVRNQKDSIVDALYPIMGNMISKYVTTAFSDMMHEVNDKIQNSLSFPRIKRKIKSKIYRISEAELLLQESNFVDIRTIFLIHKESGLLIADLHKNNENEIEEAEMVASMLSAIRSFVNEWISNHNKMSEISEIEYGSSSIHIESAGSCYLAVVSNSSADMKDSLSKVLSQIVDKYSLEIAQYDGDNSTIDIINIKRLMAKLFEKPQETKEHKTPLLSILLFSILMLIPIAYYTNESYESYLRIERENKIKSILKEHHIHVYDLHIKSDQNSSITIGGLILKDSDKNKTDYIFKDIKYTNNLKSIDQIFDQTFDQKFNKKFDKKFDKNYNIRELIKLKKNLNQIVDNINRKYSSDIKYSFEDDIIIFKGTIIDKKTKEKIITKLSDNFGRENTKYDFALLKAINSRIYFDVSSDIILKEYNSVLDKIVSLHKENSKYIIKISAYTDTKGSTAINKKISYRRANRARVALIKRGVDRDKIIVEYKPTPPDDLVTVNNKKSRSLSRCVIFQWEIKNSD